jgi:putative membrane protein
MRLMLLITASLALASCNRETADTTLPTPVTAPAPQGAPARTIDQIMPAPSAAEFVSRLAMADLYASQASTLALERSRVEPVRTFAQSVIANHRNNATAVAGLAQQAGVSVPTALDQKHADMMNALRSASAADFDDRYVDQQTEIHNDLLALQRSYAANGTMQPVQAFATAQTPRIESRLQQVRALESSRADD